MVCVCVCVCMNIYIQLILSDVSKALEKKRDLKLNIQIKRAER